MGWLLNWECWSEGASRQASMMACRGCRCEYVRPVITDEGLALAYYRPAACRAEAHWWIIWSGTWRVRRPEYLTMRRSTPLYFGPACLLDVHMHMDLIGHTTVYHTGPNSIWSSKEFRDVGISKEFRGVGTAIFSSYMEKCYCCCLVFVFTGWKRIRLFFTPFA